jgi:hypothetical protein
VRCISLRDSMSQMGVLRLDDIVCGIPVVR